MITRIVATQKALNLISKLQSTYKDILFHQSDGCCDGSIPICYLKEDFIIGDSDKLLGEIGKVPFYISKNQFEYYQHTQLIIDAKEGNGSEYSLEWGSGWMFTLQSRLFKEELEELSKQ